MTKITPTILLIDDKQENLFSLKNILTELECEILTALSAKEGLKILHVQEIACLLLDVHMPEMNGFEMVQIIRNDKQLKNIPVVFVTAVEFGREQVKKGYDLGAIDYLIKPLNPNLVRNKVALYCQLFVKNKEIENLKLKK